MYLTWLDNNSWLIEMAGQRVLLDPWMVGPLVFSNQAWLIKGCHTETQAVPAAIDLILLSQGLEDHAHPETLQQLDRNLPVIASPNGAKVAQALNYQQVTPLVHGETFQRGDLQITAVPGAPIGPFLTENGYLLTDKATQISLYYEPHGYHAAELKDYAPIHVVITPVVSLELPLLGPIIQGRKTILDLIQQLQPQVLLPTAAGGNVIFEGVLTAWIRSKGSPEEIQQLLQEQQISTQLMTPKPGERVEITVNSPISP